MQVGRAVPTNDGPLYRFSFFGALAIGIASVALGIARRAIAELVVLAADKRPQGSSRPLAERAPIQAQVASAEAALRSARAFVDDAIGEMRAHTDLAEHVRHVRIAGHHVARP